MDDKANAHKPVLGICLGMQEMALHKGGRLTQHMPDVMGEDRAKGHAADALHEVRAVGASAALGGVALGTAGGASANQRVASWHHQAVNDPGALTVVATSDDGVIEAVEDPTRPFYLGVQWHPERSPNAPGADDLADGLFRKLVERARR
jgi:putative glutamine amidotransferase